MSKLTAILAGATGLVGGECLRQLLASPRYERVIVVTRRELGAAARHDKLREVVVEFDRLGDAKARLRGDHVFCALARPSARRVRRRSSARSTTSTRCGWPGSRSRTARGISRS